MKPLPACASRRKFAADKLEVGASAVFQGAQAGDTQHRRQRSHLARVAGDEGARRNGAVAVGRSAAPRCLDGLAGRRQTRLRTSRSARLGARDRELPSASTSSSRRTRARAAPVWMRATSSPRSLTVSGEVQHQDVLASDATRLLASADVRMNKERLQRRRRRAPCRRRGRERRRPRLRSGFRHGERRCLGRPRDAARSQADCGHSAARTRASTTRRAIILGVDYHLSDDTTLFAEYETRRATSSKPT